MAHKVSPARRVALDAFIEVMEHNSRPEDVLEKLYAASSKPIKKIDRGFAKEALYGSLRWYSKIYWILQNTSKRDLKKSSPEIRAALIIGTYQIFYMDRVPDRASVNESAEYVRSKGQSSAVSFVNGILRQISRKSQYYTKPDKEKSPNEYLALQYAHPRWLVDRWSKIFKFDRLEKLLASNNQKPPYTIRVNSMLTPIEKTVELQKQLLREEKIHSENRPLRGCLTLKDPPNFEEGSLFNQGLYTMQDESSQLIANLVAPKEGETIIDTCAGPGGKLSHIYELGKETINLIAIEKSKPQMIKAKETMARLKHEKLTWIEDDFLNYDKPNSADKILIDSPCSGLGVIRRHPEGKWHKESTIVNHVSQIQKNLITHAIKQLKVGGELIYSVCSFEVEETSRQLSWVREKFDVEVVSPISRLPDYYKMYVTRENLLLVYSGNKDNTDGFASFIVKKVK